MRQLIVLSVLLLGAVAYRLKPQPEAVTIEPYVFEDIINATIEGLRPDIPDTLQLDNIDVDLPEDGIISGTAGISNLQVKGLHDFQLTALNFALIGTRLNFTLVVPVIDFYTDFNLDFHISDAAAIWGDGNITAQIVGAEIQASAQANLTDGISVSNLRIGLQLEDARFEIHGLLDDEELSSLLSSLLNDLVSTIIDGNQELISEIISPIIQAIINGILGGLDQTTDIITGLN